MHHFQSVVSSGYVFLQIISHTFSYNYDFSEDITPQSHVITSMENYVDNRIFGNQFLDT